MRSRDNKLDRIISNIDRQVSQRDPDKIIGEMYNGIVIIVDELKKLNKENRELKRKINILTGEEMDE